MHLKFHMHLMEDVAAISLNAAVIQFTFLDVSGISVNSCALIISLNTTPTDSLLYSSSLFSFGHLI